MGHNGAGKTTTMNMLTGMLEPTSGDIFFGDLDFKYNINSIRKKLGYCPQKNIHYGDLTVLEHLELIGAIKGIPLTEFEKKPWKSLK